QHDPVRSTTRRAIDGTDAAAFPAHADLRLVVHVDFGDEPAGGGVPPDEVDAGNFADHAAPAVATDEIVGSERRLTRDFDVDAVIILRETGPLSVAQDRHSELGDPVGEDALEVALPQREQVVASRREI